MVSRIRRTLTNLSSRTPADSDPRRETGETTMRFRPAYIPEAELLEFEVIGAIIQGRDGSVWGEVIADEGDFYRLENGRVAKKTAEDRLWFWMAGPGMMYDESETWRGSLEDERRISFKSDGTTLQSSNAEEASGNLEDYLGATVCGIDGDRWGYIVGEEGMKWTLDNGRIAKKGAEGKQWYLLEWFDDEVEDAPTTIVTI
mmetsp:Transcript_9751/g.15848  ORF Transcript_9751/g.15848 Transcript_9751/m.15848 type:complete len:201 (+) Transcript_9751:68-670(+)